MEEVGYITETMARLHREEAPEGGEENALMQGRKKLKRGEGQRRDGERMEEDEDDEGEGARSTSSAAPGSSTAAGERNTRNDPVPREEHLTTEDWAIMTAVETCVVWRS